MFYDKQRFVFFDEIFKLFFVSRCLFDKTFQNGIVHHFVDAEFCGIAIDEIFKIDVSVAHDGVLFFGRRACLYGNFVDAEVLNFNCIFFRNIFALGNDDFAGGAVHDVFCGKLIGDTSGKSELFVEFMSAYAGEVVLSSVEEQTSYILTYGIDIGHFAGTQLSVEFFKSGFLGEILAFLVNLLTAQLFFGVAEHGIFVHFGIIGDYVVGILCDGGCDERFVVEKRGDFLVSHEFERFKRL